LRKGSGTGKKVGSMRTAHHNKEETTKQKMRRAWRVKEPVGWEGNSKVFIKERDFC